jgi:RNA recognition motif-containing protein
MKGHAHRERLRTHMKLFVGNLSYDTTEDRLRELFEQDGRSVNRVTIVTDRDTGRSRGFGFVEMASAEDGRAAIEALNGMEIDGRTLRIDEAHDRPRGGGGGGGGGRGGGRGGGYGGGGRY